MADDTPSAVGLRSDSGRVDDIIRVASYNRRDFSLAVIRQDPCEHQPVRSSMAHLFKRTPLATLGILDTLPLEILHEILQFLTIESLFLFRHVNLRARQIVSTVRGYQPLILHALEAFCAVLRTNISSWYTLRELFDVLCTRDCLTCGSFGGFVFLPSFKRCCFRCLSTVRQFRVLSMTEARKRFNLTPGRLRKSVPFVKTTPGIYSMDEIVRKKSLYIASEQQIAEAFTSTNANYSYEVQGHISILRFMASTTLPYFDVAGGDIQHGICCIGCQMALEGVIDSAKLADACERRDRIYSRTEFLGHFNQCREAQNLWKASKEGRITVEVPESVKRRGYFNERKSRLSKSGDMRTYQDSGYT